MVWGEIHKGSFLGKPERDTETVRLRRRWESYITASLKEVCLWHWGKQYDLKRERAGCCRG